MSDGFEIVIVGQTMDPLSHGLRDLGTSRVEGIVDIEPDNDAVIWTDVSAITRLQGVYVPAFDL